MNKDHNLRVTIILEKRLSKWGLRQFRLQQQLNSSKQQQKWKFKLQNLLEMQVLKMLLS